jgi:thiol-disulfide isomerase/thioredoxin
LRKLLVALSALLFLAGCSATTQARPSTPITPAAVPAPQPPTIPDTLRFAGKTLDGAKFDASTMAGKPAVLWFWAPWCATCASEAMSISDLQDEYAGRLNILGIAGMGDNKDMHEFVSDLEVGQVPHLDDEPGKLWKKFGITEQSTYVILDKAGTIVTTGYLDDLQLTSKVKSLVA